MYLHIFFIVIGILFVLAVIFGFLLIRFVFRTKEDREKIAALNEELSRSNEELRHLDEAKSEFITIASHQMRSPLTAARGYISLLLEGTMGRLTAGQLEALHKVLVVTERLIKLIDDFMTLSKIESGKMQYDFQEVNLLDVVKEAVDEFAPSIEKKHLRIIVIDPGFDMPPVWADLEKIRHVLTNLIDNAVRYTDKGGAELSFYRTELEGAPYLGMVLEDSGRGMTQEDISHLFVKFSRSERIRKIYTEGSGLGLYVAKRIVEDHKGRIYARSAGVAKGSSFFVELPVARM